MEEKKLKITLTLARVNAGYTAERCAELCHMDVQRLRRAEKAEDPKLSITELLKFCEVCGIKFEDLDY